MLASRSEYDCMTADSVDSPSSVSGRVSSFRRVIEARVANPLFRWLLRSRFHWLVSDRLVLLSYTGHRSGREYTFPVAYEPLDGEIIVVTPARDSNWWHNFRTPQQCTVWLQKTERSAIGTLITGDERPALIAAYFQTHWMLGRLLGFDSDSDPPMSPERSDRANRSQPLAVVRFTLVDDDG